MDIRVQLIAVVNGQARLRGIVWTTRGADLDYLDWLVPDEYAGLVDDPPERFTILPKMHPARRGALP